jgi:hypothetical protein
MTSPRDDPMEELTARSLFPWIDQFVLSVVVSALGRGCPGPAPDGLDGEMALHWRALPFFCARTGDAQLVFFEDQTRARTKPNAPG